MDIQEKLSGFYKTIMNEAENKHLDNFLSDCEYIRAEIINLFYDLLASKQEKINKKKLELKNKNNKEISLKILEAKKKILEKRIEYRERFFVMLENKLREFVLSEEYKKKLELELKSFDGKKYEFRDFIFVFDIKDKDLILDLIRDFDFNFGFEFVEEDFIGGYKIYMNGRKILVDKSFLCRLEKIKDEFNIFKLPVL